jgi:septal ring factor EnvC (AmiA/AmiB activator)
MSDKKNELRPDNPECQFVTKEACENRSRASKWVVGVLFAVLSVFLGLVIYTSGQSAKASDGYVQMSNQFAQHKQEINEDITNLRSSFETHKAEQRASEKAITEKLDEIKVELSEQRKEQRVLLERILEIQIAVAREHSGNSE